MDSRERRKGDPVLLADVIKPLLKDMAPTIGERNSRKSAGVGLESIRAVWSRVVGGELARLTRVTRYRGGVLTVEVATAPLAAELGGFARQNLLDGFAAEGVTGIHGITFKTGSLASS